MPQLQITCFGTFQVLLDDVRVTAFPTDKARALLVYLAVEGQAHARTALAQLLWPGYSEESANNSLRQSLHRLRQLLHDAKEDTPWLLITRQTVQLNPDVAVSVDVALFTRLIESCYSHPHTQISRCQPCLARLRQAVDLYSGDFLANITIADSDPFEEWRRVIQEQCHVAALDALEQLTEACETKGDYEEAQRFAERQITLEPWREQAHRQLMRVLARSGRRTAALTQYHTCRQLLLEEMGSEPEAPTTSLYEQIRNGELEERKPSRVVKSASEPQSEEMIPALPKAKSEKAVFPAPPLTSNAALPEMEETHKATPPSTVSTPTPPPPDLELAVAPVSLPRHHNLPPLLTPPLGRQAMLERTRAALAVAPVVTLTGVGGVGKTTLALQVASTLVDEYDDGVWLVELARLADAQLLPASLATALGLREAAETELIDTLISYLQSKELLLLLDNCEHVLSAAHQLCSQLLTSCPHVRILATSRAPLRLREEQVLTVAPLSTPTTLPPVAELINYPAVQLFVTRVQAINPRFTLTDKHAATVLEICQRLDGLPLALELAAARVRMLSLEEIAERLDRRFSLLRATPSGQFANGALRHQTLRATIDWGYDLLSEAERHLFRHLALFAGGFTLAAVEAMSGEEALDLLAALVDKSFVVQERNAQSNRFFLLDTLRDYALEKLIAADEEVTARQHHLNFFLHLAERAESYYNSPSQLEWFNRIADEHDNLRAALAWALLPAAGSSILALRLVGALGCFWEVRGYLSEAKEALLRALAIMQTDSTVNQWRAKALYWAGGVMRLLGDYAQAKALLQESLTLHQSLHNQAGMALVLIRLGMIWDDEGKYDEALRYYEESHRIYQQLGDNWGIAVALNNRSSVAYYRGDYVTARRLAEESVARIRLTGDQRHLANFLTTLAEATQLLQDFATTRQALAEAFAIHSANGDKMRSAVVLCGWADVDRMQGDPLQARQHYLQSLSLAFALWERRRIAISLEGVARCTAALGDPQLAVELWGVAATLRSIIGSPLPPAQIPEYEADLAAAKQRLGEALFSNAWDTGRWLSLDLALRKAEAWERRQEERETRRSGEGEREETSSLGASLPFFVTPLVGRSRELAEIAALLQRPAVRLLTLMGPGGMGKTRLASAVGQQLTAVYPDGVWFVPLTALTHSAAIATAIATALNLPIAGDDPHTALAQLLQPKRLLLVLDNFEHLLAGSSEGVELVATLLQTAPNVQIMVTSRERLQLRGEQIYQVPPLTVNLNATLAEAKTASAVRLFVQSAQFVQANFQLTPANLATVLRICDLVQGIPLGLELAAAYVGTLPLNAIADEIATSAEFLTVDWHDLPPRQRSMRAVFDWSWQLLSAEEQRALRQISIFQGGFDQAAAQTVAGAPHPILNRLQHKSLLQYQEITPNKVRYFMHDLLRQFAAEKLQNAQVEAVAVAVRHSTYYLAFLAEQESPLTSNASRQAADEIQAEIHNMQQAWTWAATHQTIDNTDLSTALERAAYSLWEFCDVRRPRAEAEQMVRLVLEHATPLLTGAPDTPQNHQRRAMVSKLFALHARTLIIQGKPDDAAIAARQAISIGQATANLEGEAIGVIALAQALIYTKQPTEARICAEQALDLSRRYRRQAPTNAVLADVERTACEYLAVMTLGAGNYQGSREYMLQALQLCRSLSKQRGEQHSLHLLARLAYLHGDYETARQEYQQSLALARTLGHQLWEAYVLIGLGQTMHLQGDYPQALAEIEQGLTLAHQIDDLHSQAIGMADLCRLHCLLGNTSEATLWALRLQGFLETRAAYPESRSHGLSALAFHAQFVGKTAQALDYAQQAWQTGQEFIAYGTALSLIMLGHAQADLQRWSAAVESYESAIAAYSKIGNRTVAAEPQAGLAQIMLAQGKLNAALAQVELILPLLAEQPRAGFNDPFFIYLVVYRVLDAQRDPRANRLLQQGYDLLQQDAETLDAESRHRFLQAVPIHRELVDTFITQQAQVEKQPSQAARSPTTPLASLLPFFSTPLIGRAQALADINSHLQRPGLRLITLTGPGGMGKTRLAVEIGRKQLGVFADGVWFVPLAPISNATELPAAIATTLGMTLQGDDRRGMLLQLLRPKRLLLILDNFEQLLAEGSAGSSGAVDLVVDLLNAAPGVQMLITSRERLKLRGEQIYPVPALPVVENATLAEAAASEAVSLFVQLVQRQQANFQLTNSNLAAVVLICKLVEGMPLGLELAAAYADVLPLSTIAREIERSAAFLAVDWHDLPERQRSMRAVFGWSWQLLNREEQQVLSQLSLFRGGFDYKAAQEVTGTSLSLLARLCHKSLLQWKEAATGEGDYAIHELLRQFAHGQLVLGDPEKRVAAQQRYASYYLTWIRQRTASVTSDQRIQVLAELQHNLENCRQAWLLAVEQGWLDLLALGLPGFIYLWRKTGRVIEGEMMVADAIHTLSAPASNLTIPNSANQIDAIVAALTTEQARLLSIQRRHEVALRTAHTAVHLAEQCNDPALLASSLLLVAQSINEIGTQTFEFVPFAQRALDIARQHGLRRSEAIALLNLINSYPQLEQRIALIHEALTIAQELSNLNLEIMGLELLSGAFENEGQYARSLPYRQHVLELTQLQNESVDMAMSLSNYANSHSFLGCYTRALELRQQLHLHCEHYHLEWWKSRNQGEIAYLYWAMGDLELAYTTICTARSQETDSQTLTQSQEYYYALILTDRGELLKALRVVQRLLPQIRTQAEKHPPYLLCYLSLEARIHHQSGALAEAMRNVEEMVQILTDYPHIAMPAVHWELILIYLTCYEVLQQANDPRANGWLQRGYEALQSQAAHIEAADLRHSFLENIVAHRKLVAAYKRLSAQTETKDRTEDKRQEIGSLSALYDWAEMPAVDLFVERQAEVTQLTAWLAPTGGGIAPARCISILGMGGMGKTTLAAVVTKAMAPHFAVVIWRSLVNAPPLNELLRSWLQTLSRQTLPPPDSLDEQLRLLLTYLQQEHCLLVLDNVESIFATDPLGESSQSRAGVVRPGYEGYDQLFQRLATSDHRSCLLLTSREQPYSLLRTGRQAQTSGRVQILPLAGLDQQAGQALLQSNGLHTSAVEAGQLVETYSGNPLALQIVAATIVDFFGGDVAAFQQEEGQFFDGLRLVLDQQFARLSPLEREVLIWLAIEREPITVPMLRANLVQPVTMGNLLEALQALQHRSLLEQREAGLTLQNVIIEYATNYLIEQVCQEIDKVREALPNEEFANSFLNHFALLKAQAKEYIRQSQERLILQPLVEQLVAKVGKAQITAAIPPMLDRLRIAEIKTGYAAGNLLNLILAIKIDGGDFDFSGLALRQAFLQGKAIHNVDFRGADLSDVVFTDNFSLINSVAINPTQNLIAAGTGTGEIRMWHYSNRQPAVTIQRHQKPVWAVVFSPNGRLLASSDDQTVQLWEIEANGEIIKQMQYRTLVGHSSDVHTLAFSPNGKMIASAGYDHSICLWDIESGDLVQRFTGHSSHIYNLAFSPEGQLLASSSDDQTVRIWDLQNQQNQILRGHTGRVYGVAFHPQGRVLASCGTDYSVRLWDVTKGELCQMLHGHTDIVRSLAFHPTGEWLVSGSYDETIRLWAIHSTVEGEAHGEIHQILYGHTAWVRSVVFSPDGKTLISGSIDNTLRIWGLQGGLQQAYYVLHGHTHLIRAVAVSPDGATLVSGSNDYTLRIWDIGNRGTAQIHAAQVRQTLFGHTRMIRTISFHPNGRTIASGGFDKSIRLWVKKNDEWHLQRTLTGHTNLVRSVAFSPDGSILASAGSDQTIHLWEVATGRLLHRLDGGSGTIWSVAFHPDKQMLASGSADGTIHLWHLDSQSKAPTLSASWHAHAHETKTIAFSPDGQTLASGSDDKTIRLWSVSDPSQEGRLYRTLSGHTDMIWAVTFHPDGQTLASCSADQTICLWAIHSPDSNSMPYRILEGHTSWVWNVVFSPDGQILISCSDDETIRFWDLSRANGVTPTVLRIAGPYAGMKIDGVTGISEAQKATLKALGAVDEAEDDKMTREQGDKVTESPIAPVTLSPSHLVTSDQRSVLPLLDWAEMPAVDWFVERQTEVAQLMAWLAPQIDVSSPNGGIAPARLISILGMGGMGKTTLAAVVTKAVAASFRVVIWRSLLNAPPLSELLRDWLQTLSRQTLTTLPDSLDEQLRLLLTYLQQEHCLLVLDNVESIFATEALSESSQSRAGMVRPGYEGYDQLFQRLANSDHQSCLLLTSREQPYALLRSGRQAQVVGRVQMLPLTGLAQQAGYELLQNNGLHASAAEAAQLVKNYSGNPLALQIVAATIADFFGGDVAAFQQEEGAIFDGMRIVLDQQFARLSPLERDILVWLAIERQPSTVPNLRNNFVQLRPEGTRTTPLLEALQALQNRSLLEKSGEGVFLQNVIIEYTTNYLTEQVYQEITELREALPDDELINRDSKIVTSFLNRFALLKAQASEEVRHSQVRLIVQPLANRLLAQMGKAPLEERLTTLVQQLQAVPVTQGYAGGNLLNLLLHIGSDLRGRDFTKIALWQVFLAGAYVPGLNLSGADLTGTVFTQRYGTLKYIQFDAQGDLLLADINNQRLRLLRLRDGRLYHDVGLPALRCTQPYLSPDCQAVLLTLADHQLALLDLTTGKLSPPQTRHQHPIWRICFSSDGRFVASGDSSGLICIWSRQGGQLIQERQISADGVSALAIAPDGETMASANVAGTVFLWSLTDPSVLRRLQGHDDEVATLSFLDNGRLLASGSHDLTVGVWDVTTGELRQRLCGHTRPIRKSVATDTGHALVTGGGDHFLYVWDWQRAAPQYLLSDHASPIEFLVISPDGKQAATLDLNTVVSLWDLTQGRRIDYYAIYYNAIISIQFSPDGKALVSGGSDGAVYLWQVHSGSDVRLTNRLLAHKQRVFAVAFHPGGDLIASGGDGSVIALWQRSSGQLLRVLQGNAKNLSMLDFSPDGKWLASSSGDGTVALWSIPEGRQRHRLQVHTNVVTCCAFSPSRTDSLGRPQQRLASGSFDRTLAIWDAESGELLHHLHGHTNAIGRCLFSHDGRRLISISYDETLRIWDVESGQPLATWQQLGGGYVALALHPDGEILAASCIDHTIRLLDMRSGRCLAQLHGHNNLVISLAFHPKGQLLASAGSDETIRLWDLAADALSTGQIACCHTLQAPAPYAGMKLTGVTGISEAQKAALRALGAVEE